ncbi:hypothetical protein [Actinocorallia populi]|uniref:hypothetical protein n=1 Tax=Actinocorallia populi TaxID=2079200 RepID=UPI000D08EDB3|nr:hypothetical protein [Actinocorallia populi]
MRRIVRGALFAAAAATAAAGAVAAGCGRDAPERAEFPAGLAAAVLTSQDVPGDHLPAQAQPAFRGVLAHDPPCRRLLALADGHGLRDVPRRGTAFYRLDPGVTLTQQVFDAGSKRAGLTLEAARRAAAGCTVLRAKVGGVQLNLPRTPLKAPGLPPADTLAVRFAAQAGSGRELSYELIMHRNGDAFLTVAQPGVVGPGAPSAAAAAAARAAARLPGASKLNP